MAGTIRIFQKCRCGSRFLKGGDVFVCLNCGAYPTRYVVDIHYRGKRVRIYSDKYGMALDSLARAERVLEGIRYEMDNRRFDPSRYVKREQRGYEFNVRMDEWLKGYMKRKEKGDIAPSYLRTIKRYIRMYFVPFFGNEDIRDIKTVNISDFKESLPARLSPKYRKNILDALRKFFDDMMTLEIIEKAPVFQSINVPDPVVNFTDIEDQETVLTEIPRVHWPIMWFIAKQGVRTGEARALQWDDVYLEKDLVCIRRTFSENELRETTKGGHGDWLPLHPKVKELLQELPRGTSGFVFTYKGRRYSESMPRKLWNAACKKVGIKGLNLYEGTRHTIGSDAVRRGLSIYDVKDALRHKDIRTTQKYAHLKLEAKKRVLLGADVIKFPEKERKKK
jgi:integrase